MPLLTLILLLSTASAEPVVVPEREIPPAVLVELQLLENRFDLALADDCPADRCYSNGCAYLDHVVADQPRSRSMPGLADEPGPGAVSSQEYLTRAQCTFSHESTLDNADAAAIVRRLATRLTQGWTVVSVDHKALTPIPSEQEPPKAVEAPTPVEPVAKPTELTASTAARDLWKELLPHAWWMVAIGMLTLAITQIIWAARRIGRASIEEQALLAELGKPSVEEALPVEVTPVDADGEYVAQQEVLWRARLDGREDPALTALIRDRLRAGDLPLLAKAVLRFPENFPAAFPVDGETATAKLELAEMLQNADIATLPADAAFFRALERHALAATLATQPDARVVRGLREDFGSSGLVELIGRLPARLGALLFAQAPSAEQHEAVRLLSEPQVSALCQQLLLSNRMDPSEVTAVLEVLRKVGEPVNRGGDPSAVPSEITDRGTAFDAAGALSVLLPRLDPAERASLFEQALARFQGTLPLWYREIFLPEMLFALDLEARADLLLAVEIEPLAAWLSVASPGMASRLLDGLPDTLRSSVRSVLPAPSRTAWLALAAGGRRALARGFQRQIARAGVSFEQVVLLGSAETV